MLRVVCGSYRKKLALQGLLKDIAILSALFLVANVQILVLTCCLQSSSLPTLVLSSFAAANRKLPQQQ